MVEKRLVDPCGTADHTCGRREAVDERGEQPNRLAMTIGSKRPRAWPKNLRVTNGGRERERNRPDNAMQALYTS